MKILQPIESNLLQQLIDRPDLIISQSIEIQIALAQDIQTPRSILQILVDSAEPKIAEIAKLHVNYAGELTTSGQVEIDAIFKNVHLGQNDRLAIELLKLSGVPAEFLSEWVPAKLLIEALKNPHLSTHDRVKFLTRLAAEENLEPRLEVAESIDTPAAILGQLLGDIELAVRLATQHNPNCPVDVSELINTKQSIASNWDTDPAELATLAKSHWSWIRFKVAQNPSASCETLRELALDRIYQIQLAVANNPHTSAEVLETLLSNSEAEMQVAIALHYSATAKILLDLLPTHYSTIIQRDSLPAEILERLFEEAVDRDPINEIKSACYRLLKYPNVPESVLDRLSNRDIDALRSYLSTKDQMFIDQSVDEQLNDETNYLVLVANHPNVSVKTLEKLAELPNPKVQLAVAKNIITPLTLKLELLEHLCEANDIEQYIRCEISKDPQTPVQILTKMAEDESHENKLKRLIRLSFGSELGENKMTEVIEQIIVFSGISVNIDCWMDIITAPDMWLVITTDLQSWWINSDRWIDRIAISLKDLLVGLSDDTIKHVASIFHYSVGSSAESVLSYPHFRSLAVVLVGNSSLDLSSREILTARLLKKYPAYNQEQNLDIFSALIYNSQIPISDRRKYLEILMERGGSGMLENIAANPLTPIEFLVPLFSKGGSIQQYIGKNPNAPIELLTELSRHNNSFTLDGVAQNPSTPVNILIEMAERLIADPGFENNSSNIKDTWETIQRNINFSATDSYRLKIIIEEYQKSNRANEILSRRLNSPYALAQVLETGDRNTEITVARNLRDLLPQSIAIPRSSTLSSLPRIYNPQTDDIRTILGEYAHSENVFVRLVILRHPLTPIEILERGMRSSEWLDRYAVADNPSTPTQLRQQLTQDSNRIVRAISIANLG